MADRYSVSEARSHLSDLLKELQAHPDKTIEITVNGMVMGELRAPEGQRLRIKPGTALLDALESIRPPEGDQPTHSVARDHDQYLYTPETPSANEK